MGKGKRRTDKYCARCGELLPAEPNNAKYCDACRAIAYRERYKRLYQKEKENLARDLRTGVKVRTERYGIITAQEYIQKAIDWISEKYSVPDFMAWREENPENCGEAMEEFAKEIGRKFEYTEVR